MKKLNILTAIILITGNLFAGGIVTNTNQSASWVRMPARDGSTGIDAVYFNPAGLMKLKNGLHFSISNQSIIQKREVENFYTGPGGAFGLNENLYKGSVSAPLFPSAYAVYKMDKLAFSFGFNPIGGGGSASFEKGLPSFEMAPSDLVPALSGQGVNAYRINTFFEGSSIYLGYQGGVSYKINDIISVFAGIRYVTANNSYQGYLRDIEVFNFGGSNAWMRANVIMAGISGSAGTAKTSTTALVNADLGTYTFAQAEGFGAINSIQRAQLEGALTAFGGDPSTTTISAANNLFAQREAQYNATATLLGDQEVDVEQSGTGITPVFGINISLNKLNIGIKYEMATEIEMTNKTTKDVLVGFTPTGPVTMFPDGAKFRSDMPAMLSIGASYQLTSDLGINIGSHYFFDRDANYGKKIGTEYVENTAVIDNNFIELAAGLEYMLSNKLLISGGYLFAKTGVNEIYQSDISNSLTSNTIGVGGKYFLNEMVGINLGVGYTMYNKAEKTFNHFISGMPNSIPVTETYWKNTMFLGIGVDISL